jgi:hypothetical protein
MHVARSVSFSWYYLISIDSGSNIVDTCLVTDFEVTVYNFRARNYLLEFKIMPSELEPCVASCCVG